jgi:hypothetical protein
MINVHAAVIVGDIDLASVNYRRIELVEQELDAPSLRLLVFPGERVLSRVYCRPTN